jgi:hypothetical protein
MRVKLLVSRIGPTINDAPGDEIEVSSDEAKAMFEAIPPQAVPVKAAAKTEKAVK